MTTKSPVTLKDPRYRAGYRLIISGRAGEGAIDIFATLLEEARNKYGEVSIEAAPVYYEYGNALFRQFVKEEQEAEAEDENDKEGDNENGDEEEEEEEEEDKKPAAVHIETGENEKESKDGTDGGEEQEENNEAEQVENEENEESTSNTNQIVDVQLALEMMENAFSIMEEYTSSNDATYQEWLDRVEMPRILAGIGDVLSYLGRHADAVDVYTRALHLREAILQSYSGDHNHKGETTTLEELKDRRKVVEANVLVAEELLACPEGEDVVTTETKSCLVKADERVEYARGYYNKARDSLQETIYLMGKLAVKTGNSSEFLEEKENVCYASVLVMGVGTQLEALDEKKKQAESIEPIKKKAKR